MIPCIFSFMNGKAEEDYKLMIGCAKKAATGYGLRLNPETIMSDYELAAINAFSYEFPGAVNKGCFFHFNQCLYRKITNLGMKTIYDNDDKIRLWFRKAMVLPLVPLNCVSDALSILICEKPNVKEIEDFCDYLLETWVGDPSEGFNNNFDNELWNHFETEYVRTNNNLEGFHSKLNRLVQSPKPNIFKMISLLKRQEAIVRVKYARLNGKAHNPSNKEIVKNSQLKVFKTRFEHDQDYSLEEYMNDITLFLKNFSKNKKNN